MTRLDSERDFDDDPLPASSAWGRPGGDWAGMRPSIDNPLTWSLSVLRLGGLTIRVHVLFLAYVIVILSRSLLPAHGEPANLSMMAVAMATLIVVALVHELGHVAACRAAGGQADEVLLWPLGGLAFGHPPHRWQAHFLTALGGPLVNLAIIALASPMLIGITGDWRVALPDPLDPLFYLHDPLISKSWAHIVLYMLNAWSMCLLAFNLLPMFPLDGGRLLQSALWSHSGWSASMRTAVRFGFVTGLGLAIYGGIMMNWPAVAVAAFGLIACYMTERQLAFSDSVLDMESDVHAIRSVFADEQDQADDETVQDRAATDESDLTSSRAEVDLILQKIAREGLSSLTQREQDLLHEETERRRRNA